MKQKKDFLGTLLMVVLKQFLDLNFVKNVSDSFYCYCNSAIRGEQHQTNDDFSYEGSNATTIELHINEINVPVIWSVHAPYSGTSLTLAYIPKV